MVMLSDVPNMFWGVTFEGGGKKYTQTVEHAFHISMAALEPNPKHKKDANQFVSIMVQHDQAEFLLCSLEHSRLYNQVLDLNFTEGEEVTFFLNGEGTVHLTGYLHDDEEEGEDLGASDSEDESEDSDYEPDLVAIGGEDEDTTESSEEEEEEESLKRKKSSSSHKANKKLKLILREPEDSDDSESLGDDDTYGDSFLDMEAEEDNTWLDDDDDDDEEDEEESGASFLEALKKKSDKSKPKEKKGKEQKSPEKKKTPVKNKTPEKSSAEETPTQNGDTTEKKKKKKKKKKKNKNKGEETPGSTPQTQSKPGTPATSSQQKTGTPAAQTPASGKKKTPKKQVLEGGLIVEEVKTGHGPEAKPGKMVHAYYKGTLSKSGKVFDSNLSGKPFIFKLGKKEVIQGWDLGFKGMKVGGKRRITVPPKLGYGGQSQGGIPPNSTLVFDVELRAVS